MISFLTAKQPAPGVPRTWSCTNEAAHFPQAPPFDPKWSQKKRNAHAALKKALAALLMEEAEFAARGKAYREWRDYTNKIAGTAAVNGVKLPDPPPMPNQLKVEAARNSYNLAKRAFESIGG